MKNKVNIAKNSSNKCNIHTFQDPEENEYLRHPASIIFHYFKKLSKQQQDQFNQLATIYPLWNAKINLISRKDIGQLYLHHVLHSLSIDYVVHFLPNTKILDLGTGGGFPGIPLAILLPHVQFHLVDSIHKKVHAVRDIIQSLKLTNVLINTIRAETIQDSYDFIIGRAVSTLSSFYNLAKDKISSSSKNSIQNGVLYLKGDEPILLPLHITCYPISTFFKEPFFKKKQLIHIAKS